MIRARRQLHARVFTGLAVALPLLFGTALWLRPQVPPQADPAVKLRELAGQRTGPGSGGVQTIDAREGDLRFEVAAAPAEDGGPAIAVRPSAAPLAPDLLVYWAPEGSEQPGAGSFLMGALAGPAERRLRLPPVATRSTGNATGDVLVYSLAHGEVLARFALRELPGLAAGARP